MVHSFQYNWKDQAHIYYESYISSSKNQLSFLSEEFIKSQQSQSIRHMRTHVRTHTDNETHVKPRNKQKLKNVFWMSEISYQEYVKNMQTSKNNFLIRGIPLPFSEENTLKYFEEICRQFDVSFSEWRDLKNIKHLSGNLIKVELEHSNELGNKIEAQNLKELTVHGYRLKVSFEFDENSYKTYLQKRLADAKSSGSIFSFKFQNKLSKPYWLVKKLRDSIPRPIFCPKDLHNYLKEEFPSSGGHSCAPFQFNLGRLFGRQTRYKFIGLFFAFYLLLLIFKLYFSELLNQIILLIILIFYVICYHFRITIIKWEYISIEHDQKIKKMQNAMDKRFKENSMNAFTN